MPVEEMNWHRDGFPHRGTINFVVVRGEVRSLEFEVKARVKAAGKVRLPAYALYNVCDDIGGQCLFQRLDIPIKLKVVD